MRWSLKATSLILTPLILLLAGCSVSRTENQPGNTSTDKPPASSQMPSQTSVDKSYKVVSLEVNEKKDLLAEGLEIILPDPPAGGEIRAIGFCSSPGFQVESVSGDEWTVSRSLIQAGSGCTGSSTELTEHLDELFSGKVTVEKTGSKITFSRSSYRLVLEK
ncbi:hypothetical protein SLW73_09245 [Glutamicibacter protophormiae]|uniref:hypothetical protein n=1 Tax=Glutamicibacter protophormiae TaxID=37930 RepID=UPI002A841A8E|nr:hypothetical protein [Glutamicibacter protophormiae]WPR63094.1 hypothetical protein SLW72_09250 [Glutamicibacter protophormiae]WPR66591.1 hypothetical protein SLW73_09245 [Glutamicibacter protophormiae]